MLDIDEGDPVQLFVVMISESRSVGVEAMLAIDALAERSEVTVI